MSFIDDLVQERHKSSALAMEFRLSWTNPWLLSVMEKLVKGRLLCHLWYIFGILCQNLHNETAVLKDPHKAYADFMIPI